MEQDPRDGTHDGDVNDVDVVRELVQDAAKPSRPVEVVLERGHRAVQKAQH